MRCKFKSSNACWPSVEKKKILDEEFFQLERVKDTEPLNWSLFVVSELQIQSFISKIGSSWFYSCDTDLARITCTVCMSPTNVNLL